MRALLASPNTAHLLQVTPAPIQGIDLLARNTATHPCHRALHTVVRQHAQ